MPKPAPNGSGSPELEQLKDLLIGPEIRQIADLRERIEDTARRTTDFAQALPEAIQQAKQRRLREALEPVIEKTLHNSVRRNPRDFADAVYPVMGPAIRSSISAAIRDFADTLNQLVEKSVSFRALRWRVESVATGKPFTEILMARSLLYSVEQVFLIHRQSGLLLQHAAAKSAVVKDADMVSGMLTAIQDFLSDSFAEAGQELETVDVGRFRLWIVYAPRLLLVAAVSGTAPAGLRQIFQRALDGIQERAAAELATFRQGDVSVFEPARPYLERCLMGQPRLEKRPRARVWPYFAVVGAAIAGFLFFHVWEQRRWDVYFDALKRRPGIVVSAIERHGASYDVSGLKDPLAAAPAVTAGMDPQQVRFHWAPYESADPAFAAVRAIRSDQEFVNREVIRFELGSSKLPIGEAAEIDRLSSVLSRLFRAHAGARITVSGHTDEAGSAEMNRKLSEDRAAAVIQALAGPDVPADRFKAVGMADSAPLRQGGSDWDRASNRSVSFRVED